jgi:short-subunit dehydrogenase
VTRRGGPGAAPGQAALVTGASSGIGEAFARRLAQRGVDLLITARPEDAVPLERLAGELAERHGIRCHAEAVDLALPTGPDELHAAAQQRGFAPDILVNNAGIGTSGPFASSPLETQLPIVRLNVEAVVRLTRLFIEAMAARDRGAVVNVASTAAFQPQPYFAVYAASKAFLLRFGEALWAEQRRSGVRILTVCAGAVAATGGAPRPEGPVREFLKRRYLTSDDVVEGALVGLERDQPVVVLRMPLLGRVYHVRALLGGLLTRRARLRAAERLNRWYFERT